MTLFVDDSLKCYIHCELIKSHNDPSVSTNYVCVYDPHNAEASDHVFPKSLEDNHTPIHLILVNTSGTTPRLPVDQCHQMLASSSTLESLRFESGGKVDDTKSKEKLKMVMDQLLKSLACNSRLVECTFGNTIVGASSLARFLRFSRYLKTIALNASNVFCVSSREVQEVALWCSTSSLVSVHLSGRTELIRCMMCQMPASLQVLILNDWCGGVAVGNVIQHCLLLQTLRFFSCRFSYNEWRALVAGLCETASITNIFLKSCVIPNTDGALLGGQLLAARNLKQLTIMYCESSQPETFGHTFPERKGASNLRSFSLTASPGIRETHTLAPITDLPTLIRNLLKEQPQLERLYLSHSWTVQAIRELAAVLEATKSRMKSLSFTSCKLSDDPHDAMKVIFLTKGLRHVVSLEELVLDFCTLGDKAIKALTDYLSDVGSCSNLHKLVIRLCRHLASVTSILEAVQAKNKLEELKVSYCLIRCRACCFRSAADSTRFVTALRGIRTLRTLDISENRLPCESDEYCVAHTNEIVDAVDANLSLQSFTCAGLRGDNSKLQSIGERNRVLAKVDYGLKVDRYLWPHIVDLVLQNSVSMGPTIVFRMLTQHASTWNVKA